MPQWVRAHGVSVRIRYVPTTGAREGVGRAELSKGALSVVAPLGYDGPKIPDFTKATGYMHSYLRPYQALLRGRMTRDGLRLFQNVRAVQYVLFDAAPGDGLRCAGAVSLAKAGRGFTLAFFPAQPRQPVEEAEVDHLTAHVSFDNGELKADEIHAKVRLPGQAHPTKNVPLENLASDEFHFAFESAVNDVRYLDPAGSVSSPTGAAWPETSSEYQVVSARLLRAQPTTLGCSVPTADGLTPLHSPLTVRVGLLTEAGRAAKGGTAQAVSNPMGAAAPLRPEKMRLHRVIEVSKLDSDWPIGVSLFVEAGFLQGRLRSDYVLHDLRGSTFKASTSATGVGQA
jgi:hypothetical protein